MPINNVEGFIIFMEEQNKHLEITNHLMLRLLFASFQGICVKIQTDSHLFMYAYIDIELIQSSSSYSHQLPLGFVESFVVNLKWN